MTRYLLIVSYVGFIFLNSCNFAKEQDNTAQIDLESVTDTKIDSDKTVNNTFSEPQEKVPLEKAETPQAEIKQNVAESIPEKTESIPTLANTTSVEKKGNVVEFHQNFNRKSDDGTYSSEPLELDLSNTSSAMLSAYCLHKSDYRLYFRVFEKDTWSKWEELPENTDVNNPKRKVFAPKQLNPTVLSIQFKSNQNIQQEVVFRIFTFSKD